MAQWMGLAADWLHPSYEQIPAGMPFGRLRAEWLGGSYVQVDKTPPEYLVPGNGKTKLGYLWACARPGGDAASGASSRPASAAPCNAMATPPTRVRAQPQRWHRVRNHHADRLLGAREIEPRTVGWELRQIGSVSV